jgi:hypothetical protein
MPEDAEIWQALLRAKGLTVAQLAEDLRTTRQHAHRLLKGKRSADARRDELDRALALGPRRGEGRPLYAVATLGRGGDLELVPAGDTLPLYADRAVATNVAESLEKLDNGICVVPVWPVYAWRQTVAFHAAWGSVAEPRNVFLVDDPDSIVPVQSLLDELNGGYAETVRLRAIAEDPACLHELDSLLHRTWEAPFPDEPREDEESGTDLVDGSEHEDSALPDEADVPTRAEPVSGAADETLAEEDSAADASADRFDETEISPPEHVESRPGARERVTGYLRHHEEDEEEPRTIDPAGGGSDADRLN